MPVSASQTRAADSTSVLSTVCRSKVERLMTLSTSAVAVCCWSDSAQFIEQANVLDGDDGLVGESLDEFDLLVGEWFNYRSRKNERTDRHSIPKQRNAEIAPVATQLLAFGKSIFGVRQNVRDVDNLSL